MSGIVWRIVNRIRHDRDVEPYDDWPMCPECWVRFPARELLEAHWRRDPICGGPG